MAFRAARISRFLTTASFPLFLRPNRRFGYAHLCTEALIHRVWITRRGVHFGAAAFGHGVFGLLDKPDFVQKIFGQDSLDAQKFADAQVPKKPRGVMD